jgi:hypothetical protein
MKRLIVMAASAFALVLTSSAAAALVPGVFDPDHTGCPKATYTNGVLHLAKNCPTATNAAAGADITGFAGATFTSASFTLASPAECNGGSPRFDVYTTTQSPFFLGCNNVTPVMNANGSATYTFNAATIAAGGQVPFPTGTIQSVDVLVDVDTTTTGGVDLTDITFNGVAQVPAIEKVGPPTSKAACKHGGWKMFNNPTFKNQGQCVSYVASHGRKHHHKHVLKHHENKQEQHSKH